MPFREPTLSLRDIAEAIDAIMQFIHGMDAAAFRSDPKTVAAVERKLQVISEAAVRLGDEAEILCPGLPWRNRLSAQKTARPQVESLPTGGFVLGAKRRRGYELFETSQPQRGA